MGTSEFDPAMLAKPPSFAAKIAPPDLFLDQLRNLGRPVVFTNGVFDILHRGHVSYLDRARSLGASLVVAVNTDASVRRLKKGDDRPLNELTDRMAVLAALQSVTLVTSFDEDTPLRIIRECRPDVIVKGADYTAATAIGAREVIEWGGRFVAIPFEVDRSTSALVRKIRG